MNKRTYKAKTPVLHKIGVANFDAQPKIVDLKFKLHKANKYYERALRTQDPDLIEKTIKNGIVREVVGIQERNEARKYAANRLAGSDDFGSDKAQNEMDFGAKSVRSGSEFGRSTQSPKKVRMDSPQKSSPSKTP